MVIENVSSLSFPNLSHMKIIKSLYFKCWVFSTLACLLMNWSRPQLVITNKDAYWFCGPLNISRVFLQNYSLILFSVFNYTCGCWAGREWLKIMWSGSKYLGLVMKQTLFLPPFRGWVFWLQSILRYNVWWLPWSEEKCKGKGQEDHAVKDKTNTSLIFPCSPSPNRFTAQTSDSFINQPLSLSRSLFPIF